MDVVFGAVNRNNRANGFASRATLGFVAVGNDSRYVRDLLHKLEGFVVDLHLCVCSTPRR